MMHILRDSNCAPTISGLDRRLIHLVDCADRRLAFLPQLFIKTVEVEDQLDPHARAVLRHELGSE